MICICGGKLNRIAVDCYECVTCGLRQRIAFTAISAPTALSNINPKINKEFGKLGFEIRPSNKDIEKEILKAVSKQISYSNRGY
jgi:Zn ribbon nucleic-acid-binding protein